jgi:hypothetical protein
MVASVKAMMTRYFISSPVENYTIDELNAITREMQNSLSAIVSKIKERGYSMVDIELESIDNITQVTAVMNRNIEKLNHYLSSLNQVFSENYLLSKEVLETMKIDVMNEDSTSSIVVYDDRIDVELFNGQVVSVSTDSVTSVKADDSQTITHA